LNCHKELFDKKTVSIHFRMGDYKKIRYYHPIMNYEYFEGALTYIMERTDTERVLYFCEKEDNEEIDKIIGELKKTIKNCAFIRVTDNVEDWQQLLLMSACSHNIIANSSFSWWGAYLNTNPKKIVCYPEIWFGPKAPNDTSDLFPESWTKISCI